MELLHFTCAREDCFPKVQQVSFCGILESMYCVRTAFIDNEELCPVIDLTDYYIGYMQKFM